MRSCPALGRHDDAAAAVQLGANELSVIDEALAHYGESGPKVFIFVSCRVHVIDDKDAATAKSRHRPGQLEELSTRCVWEYQVKLTEAANDLGTVPRLEANPRRPRR